MQYSPILFVFVPVITAVLIYLFKRPKLSLIMFVTQLGLIVLFVFYVLHLKENPGDSLLVFGGWNVRFAITFYVDKLTLIFLGLTLIMWLVVMLYTYKANQKETKFLFFLMFLEGVFMGLLQTNDLFNLFVFLELTTVIVTILIAYKKSGQAFRAAIYYLLINTLGAMFFLVGIIFLYYVYGTINIQIIMSEMHLHANSDVVKLAYIFMVGGISVKAALFPVFTWLPRAHGVAQSGVSALLSGLIVKAALYIFIRVNNQMFLGANYPMGEVFFWIGAVTAIIGVSFALSQKDLKQILAYHTISQVGIMMMGLASAAQLSQLGGLLHIFNHALFKSLLFLGAGVVIKTYHSKKVYEIRGVFKTMPWTAILLIVGMLSISGAPLFNGFVSKTLVKYDFKYDQTKMFLFSLINLGTVTSFIKFSQILFGPKKNLVKESNIRQHIGMFILAISCIAIGLFYLPLGKNILGESLSYVDLLYWRNWFDYALYIALGLIFYKFVIAKDFYPTRKLRDVSITFENANYLFIIYLLVLSAFLFF